MERRTDRQHHRPAHALVPGQVDGALNRAGMTADHHLANRVVVPHLAHLGTRCLARDCFGGLDVSAKQRRHGPNAHWDSSLHDRPAQPQQTRGIGEFKRTGGGKR